MKFFTAFLTAIVLLSLPACARDFYFGADLSFANEMNDCGAVYRENGKPADIYSIFKDHGANLVRIRIWNNASWTKYSNLGDVERSIRRAKALGLQVLLDFQYSDDWADAGKQLVPAAWAGIKDDGELANVLYKYTFDTLTVLDKAGLMPDLVQLGNEINSEILMAAPWRKGQTINWTRNAKLLNAAIRAVRDAGATSQIKPKVMLHIAQPENVETWFADATAAGVTDFDMIGISYYTKWSHETLAGLGATINRLRYRYPNVQVMVAETGYPWTLQGADSTNNVLGEDALMSPYRATPEGQKQYLIDLTQTVIADGGAGVVYWAPDWVSTNCRTRWGLGSSWENATFFDFQGNVLPAIDFMQHSYNWPVEVTFRFHGLALPPGRPFFLWGDFIGSRQFAIRLPDDGKPLDYITTMMPGQKIQFQVFDNLSLHARLISGGTVVNGFATETIPDKNVVYDITLSMPAAAP
ncbi:MAG: arabinogalactan endo-1,4-beta-galactosidase [Alphaproteobacteria bacterium]|nr:arabinogalactan endo-1,4-beta-galactosidase [Alphaproteobacteria bacterium]MDE2494596.1 arabinogalactan endo-1,4-beta-galactosidase [Alphaproteobacteria bacterium]